MAIAWHDSSLSNDSESGEDMRESLSFAQDSLRETSVVTNAGAREHFKRNFQTAKSKDEKASLKKNLNIFRFPWKKKEEKNEDNDSISWSNYPGGFLAQAQEKVARSSKTPLTRRNSSRQNLALRNLNSSLNWSNMSARWGVSSKSMSDGKVRKNDNNDNLLKSSDWMLSESAI